MEPTIWSRWRISNHWSSSPMNISVPLQTRPEPPRKNWEEEEQWEGDATANPRTQNILLGRASPINQTQNILLGRAKSFKANQSSAHPWRAPFSFWPNVLLHKTCNYLRPVFDRAPSSNFFAPSLSNTCDSLWPIGHKWTTELAVKGSCMLSSPCSRKWRIPLMDLVYYPGIHISSPVLCQDRLRKYRILSFKITISAAEVSDSSLIP